MVKITLSVDGKLERIKQLEAEPFKSDQENEELEKLKDEVNLIIKDTVTTNELPIKEQKKRKRTLFELIQEKRKERKEKNKATPEQINQLTLEARKAELEARINIAKEKQQKHKPKRFNISIPGKIFTDEGSKFHDSMKKKLGDNHNDKDYSVLGL